MALVRPDDAARVRRWVYDVALPLWATTGVDPQGGFVERLTLDGRPAPDDYTRMRVQARQTYVYSHAALLGWDGPALETARLGFDFLTGKCWHPDGGFVSRVTRAGAALDRTRDMYDHAFALFALAWFHRVAGDATTADWIDRTINYVEAHLADPTHGGYRESVPDALPRRQNPHMHLLEALLALHAATGDAACLERARTVVALFREKFFDGRVLHEFFADDWSPAPGVAGALVEPGHHFEWVWLLHRYAAATGDDVTAEATALYDFALAHGLDSDGLAVDEVLDDGTPHTDSKRCWPQTEALKAHLAMAEAHGRDTGGDIARVVDGLFDHYLSAGPGWWQDRIARDHAPLAAYAPASTLYHVFLAFAELLRVAEASAD